MPSGCVGTSPPPVEFRPRIRKRPLPSWRIRVHWLMTRTGRPSIPTAKTTDKAPRRGDVWLARLDKVRPIVVLSRDPMGRLLRSVISAPVTSTIRDLSTEIRLGPADGVRIESVANLDHVQLIARAR